MLVTRGLGHPGGLLVSGGLGRGVLTSPVWAPDLAPYELELADPGPALAIDPAELRVEDLRSPLVYDRPAELVQDVTLTVIDVAPVFEITTEHIAFFDPEEHQ